MDFLAHTSDGVESSTTQMWHLVHSQWQLAEYQRQLKITPENSAKISEAITAQFSSGKQIISYATSK
ncbi:MAG: hypothetical protein IKN16_01725 [Selenomonadaceae bacterium]|nr:hypothetical protein [Selenomonadaceae bacterium]